MTHRRVFPIEKLHSIGSRKCRSVTISNPLDAIIESRRAMSEVTATRTKVLNYIDGSWVESKATEWRDVINSATGETNWPTPLTTTAGVDAAGVTAATAPLGLPRTPPAD